MQNAGDFGSIWHLQMASSWREDSEESAGVNQKWLPGERDKATPRPDPNSIFRLQDNTMSDVDSDASVTSPDRQQEERKPACQGE